MNKMTKNEESLWLCLERLWGDEFSLADMMNVMQNFAGYRNAWTTKTPEADDNFEDSKEEQIFILEQIAYWNKKKGK